MITGGDPTPEQLARLSRMYRRQALLQVCFGVAFLALGLFDLSRHRTDRFFGYSQVVVGIFWFIVAMVYWSRARKYES